MFGHLKATDFTNLIEGMAIPPRRQAHLEKCGRCREQWKAVEAVHLSITGTEDDIVEPDWSEFRASVRDEMLSRAARRSVQNHRWNTWRLAPVGVSLAAALMVGLFASRFFVAPEVNLPPEPPVAEFDDSSLETESAVWAHASAFDDALSLGPEEAERFRALLENETLLAQGENPPELTQ